MIIRPNTFDLERFSIAYSLADKKIKATHTDTGYSIHYSCVCVYFTSLVSWFDTRNSVSDLTWKSWWKLGLSNTTNKAYSEGSRSSSFICKRAKRDSLVSSLESHSLAEKALMPLKLVFWHYEGSGTHGQSVFIWILVNVFILPGNLTLEVN